MIEKEEVKILKNLPETGILDVNQTWWKLKESKIMQSINGIGVGKRIRSHSCVDEKIIKPEVQINQLMKAFPLLDHELSIPLFYELHFHWVHHISCSLGCQ